MTNQCKLLVICRVWPWCQPHYEEHTTYVLFKREKSEKVIGLYQIILIPKNNVFGIEAGIICGIISHMGAIPWGSTSNMASIWDGKSGPRHRTSAANVSQVSEGRWAHVTVNGNKLSGLFYSFSEIMFECLHDMTWQIVKTIHVYKK